MPTLSDVQLKKLQPPESGRLELTDDKALGLKFRLTPNGRATWSLQVNVHGDKVRRTIGPYPEIGLADARKRAMKLRVNLLDGRDPLIERRAEAEAEKSQQTVTQVLDLYAGLTSSNSRRRASVSGNCDGRWPVTCPSR